MLASKVAAVVVGQQGTRLRVQDAVDLAESFAFHLESSKTCSDVGSDHISSLWSLNFVPLDSSFMIIIVALYIYCIFSFNFHSFQWLSWLNVFVTTLNLLSLSRMQFPWTTPIWSGNGAVNSVRTNHDLLKIRYYKEQSCKITRVKTLDAIRNCILQHSNYRVKETTRIIRSNGNWFDDSGKNLPIWKYSKWAFKLAANCHWVLVKEQILKNKNRIELVKPHPTCWTMRMMNWWWSVINPSTSSR